MTIAVAALVASCATGPAFEAVKSPQAGHAAIYLFRTSSLFGAGIKHEVWIDATKATLINGGFLRLEVFAPPTSLTTRALQHDSWPTSAGVWSGATVMSPDCGIDGVALHLTSGQIAYVQLVLINKTLELGGSYYFDYGCRLVQRTEAEALATLRGLRQVEP